MAIDLYMFLPSPPSRATLITAKYLGVDVNVKVINLFAGETRTPEFLKLNPSHTVPVLDDNGLVIWESRAIMAYLVNKYSPNSSIYPSDAQARARVNKILYFDASTLYPAQLATFASPPCQAALITAKYLGIDVNVKIVDLRGGETKTPDFLKLNPSHKVPVLVDNGFVISESRAIMAYLANKYSPNSNLYPSEAQARAQVDKLLFFDAATYFPAQLRVFLPLRKKQEPSQEALEDLKDKVEVLHKLLGNQQYFTGNNLTIGDISLAVTVPIMKLQFFDHWTDQLNAWYERVVAAIPLVKQLKDQVDYKPLFAK